MIGINAVYQLTDIQRAGRANRVSRSQREQTRPDKRRGAAGGTRSSPDRAKAVPREELPTLRNMLNEHFVGEVRRRDHDGDGYLNRAEYGGDAEEFRSLDRDQDGRVSARDLAEGALRRNPDLREVVDGVWAPVYSAIVRVKNPTPENLKAAVNNGIKKISAEIDAGASEPREPAASRSDFRISTQNHPTSSPADLTAEFTARNPDLKSLHDRLSRLADQLGRVRRYTRIDLFG